MDDTKAQIVEALETLSKERQREVLDYVKSLRDREERRFEEGPNPEENPLLDFIGGASHGSLAEDIDEELYAGGKS